jgi:transcriptional regulator with AAA-type ATPase domain/NAD-dependent dihydropyrimidine dehydrogenase PreA subunit
VVEDIMMDSQEVYLWLNRETTLADLPKPMIVELAARVEAQAVSAGTTLVCEDCPPEALVILREGRLECVRRSTGGTGWPVSLLSGAVLNLGELLLEQNAQQTVTALVDSLIWVVDAQVFREVASHYPDLLRQYSRSLAENLTEMSKRLETESQRQAILRPYLVSRARRGIIGTSRYAVALRQQIQKAAHDRLPVLLFGEPGLEKDNAAALIHFNSPDRRKPCLQINEGTLEARTAEIFGRSGGSPGLLEALEDGTVIFNNVHKLPLALQERLIRLLAEGTYTLIGDDDTPRRSVARILMTAEKTVPGLERLARHTIKIPPLRVRREDLEAQARYYLNEYSRSRGLARPTLSLQALRRLQGYDFPGNLSELLGLLERAVEQSNGASILQEEVFWPAQPKARRFRLNLLDANPALRQFLRSPWWPDRINYGFTLFVFAAVVGVLLFGPQDRAHNFALNLFWCWWWPLILLAFPFVGRLWCSVCPFMIYGELLQKLSLIPLPRTLRRWPRQEAERWGGWFAFALFALIFLWEELWNLEDTAWLSGCLLLLITAGAVIFSQLFERRFWCRYLCPIGAMNGLYAKLAITELRAQQGICSAECTTYQCYKGGPAKGEGQATNGCPLYSHPAQLTDNRDCVLCMTCLKACPHRSVGFNLRPPAVELWTTHTPRTYEAALLLLLLGGIFLHHLNDAALLLGLPQPTGFAHLLASLIALVLPAQVLLIALAVQNRLRPGPGSPGSLSLCYGFLPLVLGGTLAHYLNLGLGEAGRVLPAAWATFGLEGGVSLPVLVAHPAVIAFLQGTTLIVGIFASIWLTQKIGRQSFLRLLPLHLGTVILAIGMWQLIVGN